MHDSADKYPEFGNNTHMEPFHSRTGHLKDLASSYRCIPQF